MHPFEITMIMSSTSLTLMTALLLIIRTMPTRRGIGWWISAAILQSVAYLLALSFHGEGKSVAGDLIFYGLQTSVNHFLIVGTLIFIGHKINLKVWLGIPVMMLVATSALLISNQQFLGELLFAVENSVAFALTALAIFRSVNPGKSIKVMGFFCTGAAIHWLDYPFLADLEWFAPIGFTVGMILGIGMFMSLSTMAMLQFREHTKRSELRAIYSATHDPLTGLYNRSYLAQLFNQYAERSKRSSLGFALLYLDLDGFKAVNDKFGHKAGDKLLVTVAKRLEKWLGDRGDAIRIGGDEIIVLARFRKDSSEQSVYRMARLILDMIELPIVDGNDIHRISSSIGGCNYSLGDSMTLDQMISSSDKQMYKAKQAGGHCIFFPDTPESGEILLATPERPKKWVVNRQKKQAVRKNPEKYAEVA